MSKPIALSDTQMDTIVRLAGPLPPPDRDVYLREVAAALDGGREEIGDGFAARVCAEVQRRLWHPHRLTSSRRAAKHRARPARANASPRSQGRARPGARATR
jgi:hypothetical protein